ncbi:MAG: putative hydrolase, alpha/beta fold family [Labilithrix sp.]|nr:putative hydrolase, alpha/beta fold family [Labilithrix sp.]
MSLAHAIVTAPSATPTKWMLFLHGILGSGANWRTFAKQIIAARPEWGAVLVDLRLHGESHDGFASPHTLEAVAGDVVALMTKIENETSAPVRGILGHSFGGKVALDVARLRDGDLDQLFVIDSTPSARPDGKGSESTRHIVDLLSQLPDELPDRNAFTAWIEGRGVSRQTSMWLAMNVRPIPNTTRFVFRLDIPGIREMLADYFRVDCWDILEHPRAGRAGGGTMQSHLIVGGRSGVVDAADRAHAERCPETTLDVIEEADHWVHVDAPDALRTLVLGYLGGATSGRSVDGQLTVR